VQRLRLYDCRNSRLPSVVGLCASDILGVANYVNGAQRRLVYADEAGDEGWWGTFAEIAFQVSMPPTTATPTLPGPYATFGPEIARLEAVNLCERPVLVNNPFVEYLQFGNGRMPKNFLTCDRPRIRNVFTRNNVPTKIDLTNPPQNIWVYFTDPGDIQTKRILIQGTDANNNPIYTLDGTNRVLGVFLVAQTPFVAAPMTFNSITGIQKDITNGAVQVFQVDPVTGLQTLLVTLAPNEQTAWYRRYFFDNLPPSCCFSAIPTPNNPATLPTVLSATAIAKLELLPVYVDTDYCLIQNLEALIEECRSIRYSEVDNPQANMQMSINAHKQAVKLLRGELAHYLGIDEPAVDWAPFGSARLERQKIGTLI
jgi:hypothetical protein